MRCYFLHILVESPFAGFGEQKMALFITAPSLPPPSPLCWLHRSPWGKWGRRSLLSLPDRASLLVQTLSAHWLAVHLARSAYAGSQVGLCRSWPCSMSLSMVLYPLCLPPLLLTSWWEKLLTQFKIVHYLSIAADYPKM